MKRKKYRRSHGAVTVFLTLILVPCIVVVCGFGDVSRIALSKSQATAASDLAMYSLLSNYDEHLKEWYGLVASCQNIDEFYDRTEKYFNGMMSANGIDETASELFSQYLASLKNGDNKFADFLQAEIVGDTDVKAVDNSSLKNPALIEDSIVEFMKYRGPVNIFEKFIDRMKQVGAVDDLDTADRDKPIVDAKKEYAEAEGEFLGQVLYTYMATRNYVDYYKNNHIPDQGNMQNVYPEHLSLIYEELGSITELITKYYSFTDGMEDISGNFPLFSEKPNVVENGLNTYSTYGGSTFGPDSVGAVLNEDSTAYQVNTDWIDWLVETADTYIENIEKSAVNIENACSGIKAPSFSANDDVNPAVYYMKMQNTLNGNALNSIQTNGRKMMETCAKIQLAMTYQLPEEYPNAYNDLSQAQSRIESTYQRYLTYTTTPNSNFETILNQYKKAVGGGILKLIKEKKYGEFYSNYCNRNVDIGQFFDQVRSEFEDLTEKLRAQIKNIDVIVYGGHYSYGGETYQAVSLDKLKSLAEEYKNSRQNWGNEANSENTTYAQKEQDEYKEDPELNKLLETKGTKIIDDYKDRLLNIKADMNDLINHLENFKYGGSPIYSMNRNIAISSAKTVVPTNYQQISDSLSQNENDAKAYTNQLRMPSSTSDLYQAPMSKSGEAGNNPNLDDAADMNTFYKFMKDKLKTKPEQAADKKKEVEEENKKNKEKAQKEADDSQGYDTNYIKGHGENQISINSNSGDVFNATSALTGTIGVLKTLIDGNLDEIRDRLYVTEYAMDMFGYSSFDNEGKFKLQEDPAYKLKQFKDNGYDYSSEIATKWNTESKMDLPQNQSLTNQPINKGHNEIHLGEVEYILFGQKNVEENLKKSYAHIFAFREALNLVSAFQNFYKETNSTAMVLEGIAVSIQEATMGIVPIPLTKVVLLGVLSTMETAHDLNRLKAGMPVVIYKNSDAKWFFKISTKEISSIFGDTSGWAEADNSNGIYYSDYMYIYMLIASNTESTYKGMLTRIGDLVSVNMRKQGDSEFDLEKAQCYFQLESKVKVKPLFLTLPIVDSLDTSGDVDAKTLRESDSWCTYNISLKRGYS